MNSLNFSRFLLRLIYQLVALVLLGGSCSIASAEIEPLDGWVGSWQGWCKHENYNTGANPIASYPIQLFIEKLETGYKWSVAYSDLPKRVQLLRPVPTPIANGHYILTNEEGTGSFFNKFLRLGYDDTSGPFAVMTDMYFLNGLREATQLLFFSNIHFQTDPNGQPYISINRTSFWAANATVSQFQVGPDNLLELHSYALRDNSQCPLFSQQDISPLVSRASSASSVAPLSAEKLISAILLGIYFF